MIKKALTYLSEYRKILLSVIFSAVTALSFNLTGGSNKIPESAKSSANVLYKLVEHIISAVKPLTIFSVLLFVIIFYFLYKKPGYKGSRLERNLCYIFSCFISFILLLCESYDETSSWDLLFGSKSAILISVIRILGFSFAFFALFSYLSNINVKMSRLSKDSNSFNFRREVLTGMAIILICWLPYMILLYPGCFSPDSKDQLAQALNNAEYCWTQKTIVLLDDSVIINNHHPVLYTVILGFFYKLGKAINSYTVSFEILCIIQAVLLAFAFSFALATMKKYNCRKKVSVLSTLFFALNPMFPIYAMTVVKDSLFCVLFVFTAVQLYEMINTERISLKRMFAFFVTLVLFMLIRNNGFYIMSGVFLLLIILLFKEKKRILKVGTTVLCALLVFQIGFTSILFPALNITPGSRREMLSVPFVQTARYISEYREEISQEDEEAILKVLSGAGTLEKIADLYNPVIADPVKSKYNKYATNEDLINYFKVWFKGLKAHPDVYVQAYLNLHYGWFSFEGNDFIAYSNIGDREINDVIEEFTDYMGSSSARKCVNTYLKILNSNPLSKSFIEMSAYSWIYIFLLLYSIKYKCKKSLITNSVVYVNYLICFLGPVAYMRYAIPMVCMIPFSIFITFNEKERLLKKEAKE